MNPLDGLVVVSLEQAVAAPFATRQLADLGARVIKIERPGAGDDTRGFAPPVMPGTTESAYFVGVNRNKQSSLKIPREFFFILSNQRRSRHLLVQSDPSLRSRRPHKRSNP